MTDIKLTEEEIVLSKEKELLDAMKNSDIDKLDELIHPDLIFNIPNGLTTTKMMDIEAYRSGNMSIQTIESENELINIIGDTVIVSVVIKMKGNFNNQSFNGKFRFLRVWKKINNQWKIIAGSSIHIEQ